MKVSNAVLLAFLLIFNSQAYAGIRPSFGLDYCSWQATHIVVATEGGKIDGKLVVLESLKGDLHPGEIISVPDLASFKPKSSRLVKALFNINKDEPKIHVSGSRMVLFLKKNIIPSKSEVQPTRDADLPEVWEAASREGINVSVIWIEGDKSFAFIQVMNPGPSILTFYGKTETVIKERILEVIQVQGALNDAITINDISKRAEALESFALSDFYFAREVAFAELRKCKDAALPVLRRMLYNQAMLSVHDEVIKCLTEVGGEAVGDELTQIVKEEMEFWKTKAPQLKEGWWNEIEKPETEILRDRYGRVLEALYSLRKLRSSGSKEVVTEFRDFWRSLPQLEDKRGLNQMSEACDDILRELSSKS